MNKEQKNFHRSRRNEFSRLIGKDSIAIIFGSTHKNKSYDGDYEFKQYKNFYYLTGFTEPNAALVLSPGGIKITTADKENVYNEILYVQKKDPLMETWNGKRMGYMNSKNELSLENAFENEEIKKILYPNILKNYSRIYINFGEMVKLTEEMNQLVSTFFESLNRIAAGSEIIDTSYILGKMRAVKTPFEIKKMQKAADITVMAYNETMKMIKPGINERQVQATLEYNYKYNGGESAYGVIAASGENACILHYESNNMEMKKDELILIDSAAEYEYYCSDVTRTFPVSGKFSIEQRIIYDIVLRANKESIKKMRPGVKWTEITDFSSRVLADGLSKAGLLKNKKDIKKYSLHGLGHHIGLDTHDAVPYMKTLSTDNDTLREGNVMTVEPGLYFNSDMKEIPQKFRGMGVRIEDDVLVTKKGYLNLTVGMVKEADEIEKMMNS